MGSICSMISLFTRLRFKELDKEAMKREERLFKEYLESQGYDITLMGLHRTYLENNDISSSDDTYAIDVIMIPIIGIP